MPSKPRLAGQWMGNLTSGKPLEDLRVGYNNAVDLMRLQAKSRRGGRIGSSSVFNEDAMSGGQGKGGGYRRQDYSIFGPQFFKDVTGTGKTKSRYQAKNLTEGVGSYIARLGTDMGSDSSRMQYWKLNHPMPNVEELYRKGIGQAGRDALDNMNPTQRSLTTLATIGIPVGVSMGHIDLFNPGEQFRVKGHKQEYAEQGSDDRRYTAEPVPELLQRVAMGRQGQPLKYASAKKDIPSLTPQRYGNYMNYRYQDQSNPILPIAGMLATGIGGYRMGAGKRMTAALAGIGAGLGAGADKLNLVKFTGGNLEGKPEMRLVGFPFGLQAAGAVAGGILGSRASLSRKMSMIKPKVNMGGLERGFIPAAAAVAGAGVGEAMNMAIASANRPQYPTTREYGVS